MANAAATGVAELCHECGGEFDHHSGDPVLFGQLQIQPQQVGTRQQGTHVRMKVCGLNAHGPSALDLSFRFTPHLFDIGA